MPEVQPAAKLSLSFAKLVATPNDISWSQAYNAGNLFVCLSLAVAEAEEELSLQALGKETFNVLQSEFFTLEEKNIENIKTAIQASLENMPEHVTVSLVLAFFKDAILLVFIAGGGKIVMKRGEKAGTLLHKQSDDRIITSASGFVEHADTIVLETGQFAQGISQVTVTQALELALPNDIVEALSPQIHKQDNGAQAAIVISYRGTSPQPQVDDNESEEDQTLSSLYAEESSPEQENSEEILPHHEQKQPMRLPKLPKFNFAFRLNHRRKLFLNIALILAFLLALSIFFTVKKYNDDKEQALFQSVYPTAQQYYSEGQGLATVNASMSQDSYRKAEKLLKDNQSKFPEGSKDAQQIADLLTKVTSALQGNASGQSANVTSVQPEAHSLLADEQTNSGLAYGQDDTNVYMITGSAITSIAKTDGTTKTIIKNNGDWSSPVAIVPYLGNIYVLDQKNGILKFVAGSGGYGKSHYFSSTAPDLSQAAGMAIDGSVWLLFKNGTIMEYTSGKSNGLSVSGLLKPLNNPTRIVTDITMESMYVLDTGNSRIVQFDKNGKYQNAYSAPVIQAAKDFTVSEKDKIIQILSGGKVWQVSL
ncbi:MAG TPA: hypothetical protein VND99_03975 [Candidatus Acidoferrales bacterium]|nr:hypothetical protein [Candidatus Acidoferrales bacterium]